MSIITWSPKRVENLYPPVNDPVYAGVGVSGSVPTLAQVNACTGINQVKAEIGRRNNANSTMKNIGDLVYATDYASLHSIIDTLRAYEENSVYPWTETPVAGGEIKGLHLAELRMALETSTYYLRPATSYDSGGGVYKLAYNRLEKRTKRSDGTIIYYIDNPSGNEPMCGIYNGGLYDSRRRTIMFFTIPPTFPTCNTGILRAWIEGRRGSGYTMDIYHAPTDLRPVDNSDWNFLGTRIGTLPYPTVDGYYTWTLSGCNFTPGDHTIFFTTNEEAAGVTTDARNGYTVTWYNPIVGLFSLWLNP